MEQTRKILERYKLARKRLRIIPPPPPKPKIIKEPPKLLLTLLKDVGNKYQLTTEQLISEGRSHRYTKPRHEFCYRAASETKASLVNIGRFLGNRDHTTIMNGVVMHALRHNLPLPRGMKLDNIYARKQRQKHLLLYLQRTNSSNW